MLWARNVSRRTVLEVVVWSVVIWIVVFWRLGYMSLLDPDEAHYAQLTREMIRTRHWAVPLLEGVPFIDKPVFYHWLQAAAQAVFGETEFALRLPSACGALALFWTVWWVARTTGDRLTGRRATLMLATTPLTFALASIGVFDMVYTAFLFGAVACLLVGAAQRRPSTEFVGWVLLTLAVMTKGPVALVLVVIYGAVLSVLPSTRPLLRSLHWFTGTLFVAVLSAPWFVYMAFQYRDQFVRDYLLAGNLWYFTRPSTFSTRQSDTWFYLRTYLGACFPWSLLAVGAAADTVRTRRSVAPIECALWVWIVVVLGFFSVAGFKLDTYVFPAAPALCLAVALAWRRRAPEDRWKLTAIVGWGVAVIMLAAGTLLGATIFRLDLGVSDLAAVIPLALVSGGLTLLLVVRPDAPFRMTTVLVPTLLIIYGVVVVEGFPVLERSRPTAPIGRWLNRHSPPDAPVGVFGLDDWRASIRFYSRRPLVILHDPSEVTAFFDRYPTGYALMLRADERALRSEGVSLRPVGGRRAIVGRSGKYFRRQLWGRLVVTTRVEVTQVAAIDSDDDLPDR